MMRDTRNGFVALVALMVQYLAANETGQTAGARFDPLLQLRASIPEISKCRQLIVVTTEDWNAISATIQLFERTQGEQTSWQKVGKPFSGVIGSRGFAWGIGLHGTGAAGAPRKMEGDETSPAGVFRLFSVFGLANPAQVRFLRFPYQQITATTEAIDDPQSRYYNRIVDRAAIARPDWSSSESMLRVGGPYRFGIMIEHNWRPIPKSGSCIFLHVWDSVLRGTAGCTAVSSAHLEQLLHWMDAQNNPLIIQLPLPEYVLLRQSWELPLNWIDELAAEPSSLDRATHPGFPRTNNIIKSIIKVTVKHIDPDEKMIFAYLNKDEVPVLCSWYEWKEWWKREGDRCQVKYDRIDDWEIETRFQGRSAALDGPPLFWDVRFFSRRIVSDGARHFGTKESALAFHAEVVERIISGEFEA